MNAREKFIEFTNFNKSVPAVKWEFGYWGSAVKRWYKEGLPEKKYPKVPMNIVNTTASLYTTVWKHFLMGEKTLFEKIYNEPENRLELPDGIGVLGGGIYFPSQGFALDYDVRDYFGMDPQQNVVCAEHLSFPHFKPEIIFEDDKYIDYIDLDGCTRRFSKQQQVIPSGLDWPIKDWESWNKYQRGKTQP